MSAKTVKIKSIFIPLACASYVVSLFLPCYYHSMTFMGTSVDLLKGWECITNGIFSFDYIESDQNPFPLIAWLSNIPFYASIPLIIFSRGRRSMKVSFIFAATAMIMALGVAFHYEQGGNTIFPLYGSYVWLASYAFLVLASRLLFLEYKRAESPFDQSQQNPKI
jgi:hypothetical protein